MQVEKKYASILFLFFLALSIALTSTAYILANTILINKYSELYLNESKYILSITENDLDQLNKTFNVLQQNNSIINIMDDSDNPPTQYTRVKSMDNINETLSSFKTFNAFKFLNAVTFKTDNGTTYWYGLGNNFFEEKK